MRQRATISGSPNTPYLRGVGFLPLQSSPTRLLFLDMGTRRVLILFKSFVINTIRLFSWHPATRENATYQSSPNPPVPVTGNDDSPHERNSEVIRQLTPSKFTSFGGEEPKVIGNTPIGAGGYANIWEATLGGRAVVLKSYRFYEVGDIGHASQVRDEYLISHRVTHILYRDTSGKSWRVVSSPIQTLSRLLG